MRHRPSNTILGAVLALACLVAPASALQVGDKAPDFTLPASTGKPVKLAELLGKGPVVIYTFIQAFTPTWTKEISGFEANLAKFEAAGAQVVGVSADHAATLQAFVKANPTKHLLLSDFRRQMLPAYDAIITDEKSPTYRYAKRAYFILNKDGVVKWAKIQPNSLDLLDPEEVLKALKESGA